MPISVESKLSDDRYVETVLKTLNNPNSQIRMSWARHNVSYSRRGGVCFCEDCTEKYIDWMNEGLEICGKQGRDYFVKSVAGKIREANLSPQADYRATGREMRKHLVKLTGIRKTSLNKILRKSHNALDLNPPVIKYSS